MTPRAASDIERIHAPSRDELMRYVERNRPVVMTGVANEWPAFRWDEDSLRRAAGETRVQVLFDERGDFQQWYRPTGPTRKEMRFADLLDTLTARTPDRRYYMTEYPLSELSTALLADVDAKRYVEHTPLMYLGRDTCMPLHYHATTEAILCQLRGDKEVLLYPPRQFPFLYAYPWYAGNWMFSRVDGNRQITAFTRDTSDLHLGAPEPGRFPKFARAEPIVVWLQAGEILFIPVHWWHMTHCPGFQISVSIFWRSSARRYTFPQPGLQVMANRAVQSVKKKLFPRR